MAYIHSKQSRFSIADSGDTLREIIGVDSVQFSQNADPVETTGIGDASKSYINGFIDTSISISGSWESAAAGTDESDVVLSGILGGTAKVFEYHPDDTATSGIEYGGSAICTSYEISSGVGDKVNYTAEFLVTTTVTRIAA